MLFARTGLIRLGPAPSLAFMATKLLPVVLCSAGALYFGNVAYLSLSVAFIQILKVGMFACVLVCLQARPPLQPHKCPVVIAS